MARHPSPFCSLHSLGISPVVPVKPSSLKVSSSRMPASPAAYFKKFSILKNHEPLLVSIRTIIAKGVLSLPCIQDHNRGVRHLTNFPEKVAAEIDPFFQSVVAEARKLVAFPLKEVLIHAPLLVVAPKTSSSSNAWTKGTLHRDFDCTETSGVYSFMLFLDEVTEENGTVSFWKHSKSISPIDPRHPERAINQAGISSERVYGPEGTVYVWDARILHRSHANSTPQRRVTVQWMVTSAGRNGISLSITT